VAPPAPSGDTITMAVSVPLRCFGAGAVFWVGWLRLCRYPHWRREHDGGHKGLHLSCNLISTAVARCRTLEHCHVESKGAFELRLRPGVRHGRELGNGRNSKPRRGRPRAFLRSHAAAGVHWPSRAETVLYRPTYPERYLTAIKPFQVDGVLVAEASAWLEDNQWLLKVANRNRLVQAIVGNFQPDTPHFENALARLSPPAFAASGSMPTPFQQPPRASLTMLVYRRANSWIRSRSRRLIEFWWIRCCPMPRAVAPARM